MSAGKAPMHPLLARYLTQLSTNPLRTKALTPSRWPCTGFSCLLQWVHLLVGLLQKAFAGKTGLKARLGQLLASNLLIAPINATVFLASMAIINGAKSVDEVIRTVRVSWVVSPLSMTIAQQFIPVEMWVPFFNTIQFVVGTFVNIKVKKMKLAAVRKEAEARERERAREATAEP
ncbi:hypothetical protein EDB19DRAFT_1658670 [Suillus lakei]|nr:hypothetical protein EDB19DRAFT_1658670 [Suillus lakei]